MILVTGATGRNGLELTKLLSSRSVPVRALVHTPEKAALLPAGVETFVADFAQPDSLDAALDGVDRTFLVTPPNEQAHIWQQHFIQAAQKAGVRHIVKMSMLGAEANSPSRFQRQHGEIEQALEESGMNWTHLRPNFFMQTAAQYIAGDDFYAIEGERRVSVVDIRDVARVAAAALTEPGYQRRTYEITGPEAHSFPEMASQFSAARGRQLRIVTLPFQQAREVMVSGGFPAWNIEGIFELHRWMETSDAAAITDVVQSVTGKPPRTFAEFAAA